jgi:formylglycine-generating enzyme required for sulfatase activity
MRYLLNSVMLLVIWFSPTLALDSPVLSLSITHSDDSMEVLLEWTAVEGVDYYGVYSLSSDPYGTPLPLEFVASDQLSYDVTEDGGHFFRVTAEEVATPPTGFILVHAGTFTMGQLGAAMPEHPVTLTESFYLAEHEVTNLEYLGALQWAYENALVTVEGDRVLAYGENLVDLGDQSCGELFFDSELEVFYLQAGSGDFSSWGPAVAYPAGYDPAPHPVKQVSWFGAACYCDWLSLQQDLPPFYSGDWSVSPEHDPYLAAGYTLPTEAEWEHAARYQDGRRYPWGNTLPDCEHANFWDGYFCVGWSSPVGSLPGGDNQLGLQDMAGNSWEWCNDWWDNYYYSNSPLVNPPGPETAVERVLRGGFWSYTGEIIQSASRGYIEPAHTGYYVGFRPRLLVGE